MTTAPTAFSPSSPARVGAWLLAAAGTVPFLAALADVLLLEGTWLGSVQIYGAIIVSFVCGIHWGAALFSPERPAVRLMIASNGVALLAWLAALLPHGRGFILLAALFVLLALVDRQLWRGGLWPVWFWHLRLAITGVVVGACLGIGLSA